MYWRRGGGIDIPLASGGTGNLIDNKGLLKGPKEGGGSSLGARGIFSNGSLPGNSPDSLTLSANTCSNWWVNGSHSWKWKSYFFSGYNKLYGKTWTTYGTSTASCDIPLVVDVIKVEGYGRGTQYSPIINKTAYNTNFVDDSDKVTWIGGGGKMCGATVTHTATKSGVTWSYISRSGC